MLEEVCEQQKPGTARRVEIVEDLEEDNDVP